MPAALDPTVQRRRLRVELRKARQDAKLTQRDVARAMEWSPSKLIRIESGAVNITVNDLRALLGHYGIKDKRRIDGLVDMARASKTTSWTEYKEVYEPAQLNYFAYESSASIIRQYEPLIVPGLLQTEEYGRQVLEKVAGVPLDDVDLKWQARTRRQELHERENPPQMFFILDEAVIRRQVGGPGIMLRQLEQLKGSAAQPHVRLQVVPFGWGAYPGLKGPFNLLEFADPNDDDVLNLENTLGDITTRDDPEQTAPYLNTFWELEEQALSHDETLALIDAVIAGLARSGVASEVRKSEAS